MVLKKSLLFCCVVSVALCPLPALSQIIREIQPFTRGDRVLILAPHPDDEVLGAGGVIQRARQVQAKIKVVCLTNGDFNHWAFALYKKKIPWGSKGAVRMGLIRSKETIAGLKTLGVTEKDIIFLGYPDLGTMTIFTRYWGETKPYRNFITGISNVPYPECVSEGEPYAGESIIGDLERILLDFKPTKIFVSHPVDSNREHQAFYLFLQTALWDIAERVPQPDVFCYLIHMVGWPKPKGYRLDKEMLPPDMLRGDAIMWKSLTLTDDEVKQKYQALLSYKSQMIYAKKFLFSFIRRTELFGQYAKINLKAQSQGEPQWAPMNRDRGNKGKKRKFMPGGVWYACMNKTLLIQIRNKEGEISPNASLFLLGYSKTVPFSEMPKINIFIGNQRICVRDKKHMLPLRLIEVKREENGIIVQIPLSVLGNPKYILSRVNTQITGLSFHNSPWRVLEID